MAARTLVVNLLQLRGLRPPVLRLLAKGHPAISGVAASWARPFSTSAWHLPAGPLPLAPYPVLVRLLRSHTPLIEPDMQISRIRLSDKTSRLCFRVQRHLQFLDTLRWCPGVTATQNSKHGVRDCSTHRIRGRAGGIIALGVTLDER